MKKILLIVAVGLLSFASIDGYTQKSKIYQLPIQTEVPVRPAGQTDVIQFTAPKLDTVRVGFIGLGMRGSGAIARWTHIPGIQIVALCDLLPERVEKSQNVLKKAGLPVAASYSGSEEAWKKLCKRKDIDLIYIATD